MCVRVSVCVCACVRVCTCVRACVHACGRAGGSVRVCFLMCVRVLLFIHVQGGCEQNVPSAVFQSPGEYLC